MPEVRRRGFGNLIGGPAQRTLVGASQGAGIATTVQRLASMDRDRSDQTGSGAGGELGRIVQSWPSLDTLTAGGTWTDSFDLPDGNGVWGIQAYADPSISAAAGAAPYTADLSVNGLDGIPFLIDDAVTLYLGLDATATYGLGGFALGVYGPDTPRTVYVSMYVDDCTGGSLRVVAQQITQT